MPVMRCKVCRPGLRCAWECTTVVHRDLYEEQIVLGDQVGLIDLDDAALGPPELDVGNLLAHLDLLELRSGEDLDRARRAFLAGYSTAVRLDPELLERCRTLFERYDFLVTYLIKTSIEGADCSKPSGD